MAFKSKPPEISEEEWRTLGVKELARRHTRLAIEQLADVAAHGENESAVVNAAEKLLSRAWGAPEQKQEISVGVFATLSDGTRNALIAALERIVERERGDPKLVEGSAT